MIKNDNFYNDMLEDKILENTNILLVEYVNCYDEHYIVRDTENLYLFNNDFMEILRIDVNLLFNKYENYDIVYRNKTLMFMDNYKDKDGIIFKYYDIYTGEIIDDVLIGGTYE